MPKHYSVRNRVPLPGLTEYSVADANIQSNAVAWFSGYVEFFSQTHSSKLPALRLVPGTGLVCGLEAIETKNIELLTS